MNQKAVEKLKLNAIICCFIVAVFLVVTLFFGLSQAGSTTTIHVGGEPYALAITPDGKYVYVPNGRDVAVIDTSTSDVIEMISAGVNPSGVAISPDGQYVYVTNNDSENGSVSVISVATNAVISTVMIGGNPVSVGVSPDGTYIYVLKSEFTHVGGEQWASVGMVSVISTATNSVLSTVPVGRYPSDLAVSSNGAHVYVTTGRGLVSVVDTSINAETANIEMGDVSLGDLVVSPNGAYVYVLGFEEVFVISTKNNTVVATVSGFRAPSGLAVAPDGRYVYVTESWNNTVSAINTVTHLVEFSVGAGVDPYGVVVSPDGQYLYVSNLDYTATDSPVVNYVGTISVVSTDPNAVGVEPSFPVTTIQLLIVVGCVVVVVAFLMVIHIRRRPKTYRLVNSGVKSKMLWEYGLISKDSVSV